MKFLLSLVLAATASAQAVLPPSWPTFAYPVFEPTYNLTVIYPKHILSNANTGSDFPHPDLQVQPTFVLEPPPTDLSKKYVLIMVDPSVPSVSNVLHALLTDFSSSENGTLISDASVAPAAYYFGPGAPDTDLSVHSYTFVVFEQGGFRLPSPWNGNDIWGYRVNFDVKAFQGRTGLGEAVAGQYMNITWAE